MPSLADIMSDEVLYLHPSETVRRAAEEMKALNVGVIPICDDERRLLGLITDRDIVLRVVAEGRNAEQVALDEVASFDPIAGQSSWSLDDAAEIMSRYQIRRLPVVEAGKLIGIVSLGDIAVTRERAAGSALEEISRPAMPRHGAIQEDDQTT